MQTLDVSSMEFLLKRLTEKHITLLRLFRKEAPMTRQTLHRKHLGLHDSLMTLKRRELVVSRKYAKGIYRYDLTDLGLQVLEALETKKTE